jgi:hypothetical protein
VQQLDPGYRETIDAYQTAWEAGKLDGYYTVTVFGWPRDEKINTIYVTGPYATYERARTDAIWFEQSREGSVVAWEVVGGPRKMIEHMPLRVAFVELGFPTVIMFHDDGIPHIIHVHKNCAAAFREVCRLQVLSESGEPVDSGPFRVPCIMVPFSQTEPFTFSDTKTHGNISKLLIGIREEAVVQTGTALRLRFVVVDVVTHTRYIQSVRVRDGLKVDLQLPVQDSLITSVDISQKSYPDRFITWNPKRGGFLRHYDVLS